MSTSEAGLAVAAAGPVAPGVWSRSEYRRRGYAQALDDVLLQPDLLDRLRRAGARLAQDAGHGLLLLDGWRPSTLQRELYEEYAAEAAQTTGLTGEKLRAYVARFVTDPERQDPPPAHATGGAVDLTLCDPATGAPRDLGGDFDELTSRSEPDHYAAAADAEGQAFHALRVLLRDALAAEDLVQLPTEWWHFEYGTALWAEARGAAPRYTAVLA